MITYLEIATADPGGDLELAYNSLMNLEEEKTREGDHRITLTSLAKELGRTKTKEIYTALLNFVSVGAMQDWELEELKEEGFDINDPVMRQAITDLGLAGLPHSSEILALNLQTVKVYKGLTIGYLSNARRMKSVADADPGGNLPAAVGALLPTYPNISESELKMVRQRREKGTI